MKKTKLITMCIIAMTLTKTMYSQSELTKPQSIFAYIYSCLWFQQNIQENNIPDANSTAPQSIIFDLDGVLSKTNNMQAFQEIGIITTLKYIFTEMKIPCEKDLFDALETADAKLTYDSFNKGLRLPNIMIDWQCGARKCKIIQEIMENHIRSLQKSKAETDYLIQTIKMMTDPEKFIATRQTIPAAVSMLHELKDKGYKVYILSNWDPESFPLFIKKFPEIFTHNGQDTFDGIIISGKVGVPKPQASIFEKCLTDFHLQTSNAIFIDDTIENVQAANNASIQSIHCDPKNIPALRENLINVLKSNTTITH